MHLLRRLKGQTCDVVHAPDFDRDIDESIGCAIPVPRRVPLVVTEGNYLLSRRGGWVGVAPLLDESWYLQVEDGTRQQRLAHRHQRHGMTPDQAATWARTTDQDNAGVVAQGSDRADLLITVAAP